MKAQHKQYECAPMDGVTDYVFRQVHARHFTPADSYYTPFLSLTRGHGFQKRESNEFDPEHNRGLHVIPQVIGNNIDDFRWGIRELEEAGYTEININAGCPSKVVVRKGKGAGMLGDLQSMTGILDRIFSFTNAKISIKTRIGLHNADEFPDILEVLDRFPFSQLIIHGRVSDQNYEGTVYTDAWNYALSHTHIPLCYNGDLFDRTGTEAWLEKHSADTLMLGRGLIANPALIGELKQKETLQAASFQSFLEDLADSENERLKNDHYTLIHMKEYWSYWSCCFINREKVLQKICRSQSLEEYRACVHQILEEEILRENAGFQGMKGDV